MKRSLRDGTSLVELLVVIVIFAIGILSIVQLFPAGFRALNTTRNNTIASQLARNLIESVKGRADQLPERIHNQRVVFNPAPSVVVDPDRSNTDLAPAGVGIDGNGNVIDAGNNIVGPWGLHSASNNIKRIEGEGGRVPAPRTVGAMVGGLMVLQFSPIVYDPAYTAFLRVYGNDMVARYWDLTALTQGWNPGRFQTYEFYVSDVDENGNPSDTIAVPIIPLPADPNESPYRLSFSFFINDGTRVTLREISDPDAATLRAALQPATTFGFPYWLIDVAQLVQDLGALGPGESYVGLDDISVRVQRNFIRLDTATAFSNNPYEYKLLDSTLGVMLFNPVGYNYMENRGRGQRIPLVARVNYTVLDWRIIRDEFRISPIQPYQQKTLINALMVRGEDGADNRPYPGLGILIPNGSGGTQDVDVILQDVDTGGVYLHDPSNPRNPNPSPTTSNDYLDVDPALTSYTVDKSLGLIRFADADTNAPGLQMRLILPGTANPVMVDADNRKVRALYRGKGEWSVQLLKAASRYQIVSGRPSVGQCYVGTSYPFGGAPTRVYFPGQDLGKKVTIGEIWYRDSGNNLRLMRDQDFLIVNTPADPVAMPYIDIRSIDTSAAAFDFTNGYAVRRVKGASVTARVLWNPAYWNVGTDPALNMQGWNVWARNYRRTAVETYLERGEN